MSTGKVLEPELDPTFDWVDRFVAGEDLVRYNFRRYGLLDDRVRFLRGFFNESLPPVFGSTSDRTTCYNQQCPDSSVITHRRRRLRWCIGRSRGRLPPPVAGRLRDY